MPRFRISFNNSLCIEMSKDPFDKDLGWDSNSFLFVSGGLFLDSSLPPSFVHLVQSRDSAISVQGLVSSFVGGKAVGLGRFCGDKCGISPEFLSVSLSGDEFAKENKVVFTQKNGDKSSKEGVAVEKGNVFAKAVMRGRTRRRGAVNTTNHLWAGAVAAMVSRTFVAPLERLKLEYIVRGEQRHLSELVRSIAATQGLRGFWKGNLLNILRTAPFKAVNFYAYDTYRKQLLRFSGNDETTHFERFIAGAAAGMTASVLCLPLDTIRTKLVAPGGEALGGVIGAFRHMIQTEGFFSLYKGLVPSVISMAPSSAVFYGVYDILKSAYLHSPDGRRRIEHLTQQGQELNALDQLELGPVRTLLYGAVAGACAEAATYPFEVIRRRLQLQVQATRLSAFATFVQIVENGGVPALYTGLIPSLLQVLPSASISYFVYEFMKIILKVD